MKRFIGICVTLACIAMLTDGYSGHTSRCHGIAGILRVCDASATPPPVNGGKVGKEYRVKVAGLPFRCRPHVYPGGFVIRCVLAKSPDAA